MEKGKAVVSVCGRYRGTFTGASRPCNHEGCTGRKHTVRWNDGGITYPCSKGIAWSEVDKAFKING